MTIEVRTSEILELSTHLPHPTSLARPAHLTWLSYGEGLLYLTPYGTDTHWSYGALRRPSSLTLIIHEHFCDNRRSTATTSLRPAGSLLGPSPY